MSFDALDWTIAVAFCFALVYLVQFATDSAAASALPKDQDSS